jgi:hypothetical protein
MEQLRRSQDKLCFREFRESCVKARNGSRNSGRDERTQMCARGKEIWSLDEMRQFKSIRRNELCKALRTGEFKVCTYIVMKHSTDSIHSNLGLYKTTTRRQIVYSPTQHTDTTLELSYGLTALAHNSNFVHAYNKSTAFPSIKFLGARKF